MDPEPPQTVFILKPSSFGDIIHTLPAVGRLKAAWPSSRMTWLANSEWTPLLEGNPHVDRIISFPRSEFRGGAGWLKFFCWQRQRLRGLRPDLVLDFQGLLRSAFIGRLSAPRVFYGMTDAREGARWFYDGAAAMPPGVPHAVERYLALANFALRKPLLDGIQSPVSPRSFALPAGEPLAQSFIGDLTSGFILLHPFARGEGKSLTAAQVAEFCARLAPRQVVLVGRGPETAGPVPPGSLDLLDRTSLRQLIWIMRRAAFVISVDSGPSHLAAALGRPMVAIHTWSDPRRVGPYRSDAWVSKSGQLVQMRDLPTLGPAFFEMPPARLSGAQIEAICALATSPSSSCA